MLDKLLALDTQLFLFLNGLHSPLFDKIMWFISGKPEWIPLYLILLGVLVYKFRWKSLWIILSITVLIVLSDQISTEVFKKGFERLRPSHNPDLTELIHLINGHRGGKYGFVSSHAANSFAVATFFSLLFKKKWFTLLIVFWACLVSYSRIYLGVHYPGDILCGALLGVCLSFIVYYSLRFFLNKKEPVI